MAKLHFPPLRRLIPALLLPAVALAAQGIENLGSRTRQIDNAGAVLQAQLKRGDLDPRLVAKLEELLDDAQALSKLYDDCESRPIHSVPNAKCDKLGSDLVPKFMETFENALARVHTSRARQLKTITERTRLLSACAENLGSILDVTALSRNMQIFELGLEEDVALGGKILLHVQIERDGAKSANEKRMVGELLNDWSKTCFDMVKTKGSDLVNPVFLEQANRFLANTPFVVTSSGYGNELKIFERERTVHHVRLRNRRTGKTDVLATIHQKARDSDGRFTGEFHNWKSSLFHAGADGVFRPYGYEYEYSPDLNESSPLVRSNRGNLNERIGSKGLSFDLVVDPDDWVLEIKWDADTTTKDAADIVLLNEANAEYRQYVLEERAKRGAKH